MTADEKYEFATPKFYDFLSCDTLNDSGWFDIHESPAPKSFPPKLTKPAISPIPIKNFNQQNSNQENQNPNIIQTSKYGGPVRQTPRSIKKIIPLKKNTLLSTTAAFKQKSRNRGKSISKSENPYSLMLQSNHTNIPVQTPKKIRKITKPPIPKISAVPSTNQNKLKSKEVKKVTILKSKNNSVFPKNRPSLAAKKSISSAPGTRQNYKPISREPKKPVLKKQPRQISRNVQPNQTSRNVRIPLGTKKPNNSDANKPNSVFNRLYKPTAPTVRRSKPVQNIPVNRQNVKRNTISVSKQPVQSKDVSFSFSRPTQSSLKKSNNSTIKETKNRDVMRTSEEHEEQENFDGETLAKPETEHIYIPKIKRSTINLTDPSVPERLTKPTTSFLQKIMETNEEKIPVIEQPNYSVPTTPYVDPRYEQPTVASMNRFYRSPVHQQSKISELKQNSLDLTAPITPPWVYRHYREEEEIPLTTEELRDMELEELRKQRQMETFRKFGVM